MNVLKELLSRSNITFSEMHFSIENSTNEMDTTIFVSLYSISDGGFYSLLVQNLITYIM